MGQVVWFSMLLILVLICQGFDPFVAGEQGSAPAVNDTKNYENNTLAISQELQNSFYPLFVQALDALENRMGDKLAQLQNVVYRSISSLDNKTKSQLSQLQNGLNGKIDKLDNKTNIHLSQIQNGLNGLYYKVDRMDNKIISQLSQFQNGLSDKIDTLNNKTNCQLSQFPNGMNGLKDKIDTLDNKTYGQLSQFQNGLNDKIDALDDKINSQLSQFQNGLNGLYYKVDRIDNKTNCQLSQTETNFESHQNEILNYKNQTKEILHVLTSINSTRCPQKSTTCYRGMAYDATKRYNRVEIMRDNTLNRDILCDTRTDGGGWIVIQRRSNAAMNFYRTWAAYKNGFGTPPGDFWLGNDAIHELTNKDAWELRIDFKYRGQMLFALYSSFKLSSEADKYRLRLGSHSGTLGDRDAKNGLSYHNGNQFSTYDSDNDRSWANCAERYRGGWWYNSCHKSNLNGHWGQESIKGVWWNTGFHHLYGKYTEMKIRRI